VLYVFAPTHTIPHNLESLSFCLPQAGQPLNHRRLILIPSAGNPPLNPRQHFQRRQRHLLVFIFSAAAGMFHHPLHPWNSGISQLNSRDGPQGRPTFTFIFDIPPIPLTWLTASVSHQLAVRAGGGFPVRWSDYRRRCPHARRASAAGTRHAAVRMVPLPFAPGYRLAEILGKHLPVASVEQPERPVNPV